MKTDRITECDLLVIGRGMAGMAAAAQASELGLNVVQAGSSSTLFLASGLLDFLGVYPPEKKQVLSGPESGLRELVRDIPGHPYAKVSGEMQRTAFAFIQAYLDQAGLAYHEQPGKNQFVLTSAGTVKASYLIPQSFVNGTIEKLKGKKVLFVDFSSLKAFSGRQAAGALSGLCDKTDSITIRTKDRATDLTPLSLAMAFEKEEFLVHIVQQVAAAAGAFDLVGLPAVIGVDDHLAVFNRLEQEIGKPCFEIPGLPPSIPGMRLKNAFEKRLSKNQVRVLNNSKVRFESYKDDRFNMIAVNQGMDTRIRSRGVILTTGRFQGDGLHASRGHIRETVFGLDVRQPEKRNQWYDLNFFHPNGHPVNRAGIDTSEVFQPLAANGRPLYRHLYGAGAVLADNDWARLKSGAGVSIISACAAVNHFFRDMK